MWKNLEHQENELSKRAVKSDIALFQQCFFYSHFIFPHIPCLEGKMALKRGQKCFKIRTEKQMYLKC